MLFKCNILHMQTPRMVIRFLETLSLADILSDYFCFTGKSIDIADVLSAEFIQRQKYFIFYYNIYIYYFLNKKCWPSIPFNCYDKFSFFLKQIYYCMV